MAVIATKRFAQAAFDIAVKEGNLDSWITDMNLVKGLLGEEGLTEFFNSPRLPFIKKLELHIIWLIANGINLITFGI